MLNQYKKLFKIFNMTTTKAVWMKLDTVMCLHKTFNFEK